MQKQAICEQRNAHAHAYVYIGGDGYYNAYIKCTCAKSTLYKHFFELQKAANWISTHLAKHS